VNGSQPAINASYALSNKPQPSMKILDCTFIAGLNVTSTQMISLDTVRESTIANCVFQAETKMGAAVILTDCINITIDNCKFIDLLQQQLVFKE